VVSTQSTTRYKRRIFFFFFFFSKQTWRANIEGSVTFYSALRLKEQPSVSFVFPPVGRARIVLQELQTTTLAT
jgi:hypothetical protein